VPFRDPWPTRVAWASSPSVTAAAVLPFGGRLCFVSIGLAGFDFISFDFLSV
jgi:hypothetical protein